MSTFDPEQFLNTQHTEANDTKVIPVPPGEYLAQITKLTPRKIKTKDGGERLVMDVQWEIQDESVKKKLGLEKMFARQSVFLDLTEQGSIDFSKGHNIQLGRLREACGQNKAGKKWSPSMLLHSSAYIFVEQQPNENDPESPYSNVTRVAKEQGGTQNKKSKAA